MARKKFFYNRVYNLRRTIINIIIIGICIIGIIVCFLLVTKYQNAGKKGNVEINSEVSVGLNSDVTNDMFFRKIEGIELDDIKIEYPKDYDNSKVGEYIVNINIDGKKYKSTLKIVDTERPLLNLKEIKINENQKYSAKDFVESCTDNSKEECIISFYESSLNSDGKTINYASYTNEGIYSIKISAKDKSGNETIKETKLNIGKNPTPQKDNCEYGINDYDKEKYVLSYDVTSNNCALPYKISNFTLYGDNTIYDLLKNKINKIIALEDKKVEMDIANKKLNITKPTVSNLVNAVPNSKNNLVGFEIEINVTATVDGEKKLIADYKLDSNGNRVFLYNGYNLPK